MRVWAVLRTCSGRWRCCGAMRALWVLAVLGVLVELPLVVLRARCGCWWALWALRVLVVLRAFPLVAVLRDTLRVLRAWAVLRGCEPCGCWRCCRPCGRWRCCGCCRRWRCRGCRSSHCRAGLDPAGGRRCRRRGAALPDPSKLLGVAAPQSPRAMPLMFTAKFFADGRVASRSGPITHCRDLIPAEQ